MFTGSITLMLTAILIISIATTAAAATTLVDGQQQENNATTTFQNLVDGFRIQVPNGWVVQDINNTSAYWQINEEQSGVSGLAIVCPQEETQLAVGGTFECKIAPSPPSLGPMSISRFKSIDDRPELASIQNQTDITMSDFFDFYIRFLEGGSPPREVPHNLQVVNDTDITVNIINAPTNQTVATVPGKLVKIAFPFTTTTAAAAEEPTRLFADALLVLNGTTGYAIFYPNELFAAESDQPPRPVQQIFDSFELLTTNNSTSLQPTPVTRTSPSQIAEEQQQSSSPSPFTQQLQ
jgi:flagellar basal body-associated protein FliL